METDRVGVRKRIILVVDTNFLIQMIEGIITPSKILEALESSFEIIIPESVIKELHFLAMHAPRLSTRRKAKAALDLLEKNIIKYRVHESIHEKTDDDILLITLNLKKNKYRVIIATNDRTLRRRAKSLGLPTLYYRESEGLLEAEWLQP